MLFRGLSALCFALALQAQVAPDVQSALDRISANSMRGNLSFLSSDLLEGRDTPSHGLDIAAEFIASQFRRAGLTPAGNEGYFQTVNAKYRQPDLDAMSFTIDYGGKHWSFNQHQVTVALAQELKVDGGQVVKVKSGDAPAGEQIAGKIVLAHGPVQRSLARLRPALIIRIDGTATAGRGGVGRLADAQNEFGSGAPIITVYSPELAKEWEAMPAGQVTGAKVTLRIPPPIEAEVLLRNVVGILPGSDPALKDTYILVTAHYDHIGIGEGPGDRIYNGANDDGSGSVSVIELASALASLKERPKRSIVFMTVFGEEKGLLGSRYYARHPLYPLDKTVANVNLEQVGRTDSSEGPQVANASMTGFTFSNVPTIFKAAGELTGIRVYDYPQGDDFFARSDNVSFAMAGVPAHTFCVAYEFPDYHRPGDSWDKVDYDNMAKVDRMIALGIVMIANNPEPPKWNAENPKTERYRKARAPGASAQ